MCRRQSGCLGRAFACVMASEGYPAHPVLGAEITGLEEASKVRGAMVFHAGTKMERCRYYTSGGRILGVGAVGASLRYASEAAYDAASRIRIPGAHYRRDIGTSTAQRQGSCEGGGFEWMKWRIFSGAWCTAFPWRSFRRRRLWSNKGFRGCIHGRPGSKRQVSLMDLETLEKLGIAPGLVKENITTARHGFSGDERGTDFANWRGVRFGDYRSVPSLSADGRNSDGFAGGIARAARLAVQRDGRRTSSSWGSD